MRPGKKCCIVTQCSLHNLHRLFSVSTLNLFQALVLTIYSIIDIMADVSLGVKFCSSQILHFLPCFLFISFCISFLLYFSSLFSSLLFLKDSFTCFHIGLNSLFNIYPSNSTSSPSNYTLLPFICIVKIISSLIDLHAFVSFWQASLIHLLSGANM